MPQTHNQALTAGHSTAHELGGDSISFSLGSAVSSLHNPQAVILQQPYQNQETTTPSYLHFRRRRGDRV